MRNKVTTLKDFSLIIIKNTELLESVYDYFYENLRHDFTEENIITIDLNQINDCLKTEVKTKYAFIIQEGIFFFDHMDNNFLRAVMSDLDDYSLVGHILDRKDRYYQVHPQQFILNVDDWKKIGAPDFNQKKDTELVAIERSDDNFHDDYTPLWIRKSNNTISNDRLKLGGYVISQLLKNNFKVRPFNTDERHVKKFVYYSNEEQISHMLSYEKINPYSFYYPKTTRYTERIFTDKANKYITVANAVESLYKIKDVYKEIKSIDFYDISITALIFTELFIKNFNGDYMNFVKEFDDMGARNWTTLDLSSEDYYQLKEYEDVNKISDVLNHIRQNVKVNYYYGDITRSSIVELLDEPTIMYVSNCFKYQYNFVRNSEWKFWRTKAKKNQYLKQFLR